MIIKTDRFCSKKLKALIYEQEGWEIYRTVTNSTLLIVVRSIYEKWIEDRVLFSVDPFKISDIDGVEYAYLFSPKQFVLAPVKNGIPLCDGRIAVAFAAALRHIRKYTNISLFDGIFIEEYGYILPTYTSEMLSDDLMLGSFLAGGRREAFSTSTILSPLLNEKICQKVSEITGIAREIVPKAGNKPENQFMLAGRPELTRFFNEHIISILNEPERYKKLGIDFPSAILLYGPPGCGKTYAVNKLVEYLGLPKFEINSSTIASPYIHDTAKKISEVFARAIRCAPSIVVIDEMESYLSDRNSATSNSQHIEEVAEFLRQIQNAQDNHVLVIAMTNMYDKIDPAILRHGRFDHHIEVGLPVEEEIYDLLLNITKNISMASDIDLRQFAAELKGKTLADVSFVIKEAGLLSGRNGFDKISVESLREAVAHLPREEKRRIGF